MSKQGTIQFNSPRLTPSKEMLIEKRPFERASEESFHSDDGGETDLPSKRQKCLSPEITIVESDTEGVPQGEEMGNREAISVTNSSPHANTISNSENERILVTDDKPRGSMEEEKSRFLLEKQQQKEAEKIQKEIKKLEERLQKQQQKEMEKQERERKKELERLAREKKKEEERLEREKKKEEDKLERERKKEEEKLEREKKKEEERIERERKKEEERLERERKKEEERIEREKKKEEERIEREKKKEEERLERERKKEEERLKKEEEKAKGQRKISSFFSSHQRRLPVEKHEAVAEGTPVKNKESVYDTTFLPFFKKQTTSMPTAQSLAPDKLEQSISNFDFLLANSTEKNPEIFFTTNRSVGDCHKNTSTTPTDIIAALNSPDATESKIYEMLQNIPPIKYLQFYENSKPPYIGTWCSSDHIRISFPILEPFNTSLTGYDYNYDSDLDWNGEEEGDGEDIDDEEEDEEDEANDLDDDDMEDFVEGNSDSKKMKKFLGPLVPVCQWNDGSTPSSIFDDMKYERLHVNIDFSIDPFFNYWATDNNQATVNLNSKGANTVMPTNQMQATNINSSTTPNLLTPQKPTIKDQKVIHDLVQFIEINKAKSYSIGTLTELSKNEESLKGFTKSLLKHTIQDIAFYNKSNSHWEVKSDTKEKLANLLG